MKQDRTALQLVLSAYRDDVPLEAMSELIELAARDEGVRESVLAELERQLWNAKRDLQLAWLCLVAGELGRDGLRALIRLLGETDSDDVTESAVPALRRHAVEAYPDLVAALDAFGTESERGYLYEALQGAIVLGDDALKRDLAAHALRWARRELKEGSAIADGALGLLVALRVPDARSMLLEARRVCGADLAPDLNHLEGHLEPGNDALELPRLLMAGTWRESAENVRKLFHPTPEEERQLAELAASLRAKPRGVQ